MLGRLVPAQGRCRGSAEGRVPILPPGSRFRLFGRPGRPSSLPLDSPRNLGRSALQERSRD
eukprot:5368798-Pyramimonas_sp.AAC.1